MRCIAVVCTAACLLHPAALEAQRVGASVLTVNVADAQNGVAIRGAIVQVQPDGVVRRTDSLGAARFGELSEGMVDVRVRFLGFAPHQQALRVRAADTSVMVVLLRALPQQLPPTVVSENAPPLWLQDFEGRRRGGIGRYLTEAQIAAGHGDIGAVLGSSLPGLFVRHGIGSSWNVTNTRPCRRNNLPGAPDIYIDGAYRADASIAEMDVLLLVAVEWYDGTNSPVQFRRLGSTCGVLLLWTKH